jgi:hypothetical protein
MKRILFILIFFITIFCFSQVRTTPYLPAGTEAEQITIKQQIQIANTIISTMTTETAEIKVSSAYIDSLISYKKGKVIIEGDSQIKGNLMIDFEVNTETTTTRYLRGKSPINLCDDLLPNTTDINLGSDEKPFNKIKAKKIGGASPIEFEDDVIILPTKSIYLYDDNGVRWKIYVSTTGVLNTIQQ